MNQIIPIFNITKQSSVKYHYNHNILALCVYIITSSHHTTRHDIYLLFVCALKYMYIQGCVGRFDGV